MKFICFEDKVSKKKRYPANYVRRIFVVNRPVQSARLKMTALGAYVPYMNGERLDEQVLLPGYTDYRHRVQFQEYDITEKLHTGENMLSAVVGDGWYRGGVTASSVPYSYGMKTMLGCELTLKYEDGTEEIIEADERFECANDGPLRENDVMHFEVYDARKKPTRWHAAIPASYAGQLLLQEGERVLEHERFSPKVLRTPNGETVLDFGQNLAGYVEFTIEHGLDGHTVTLTMGETLDENGNFTLKNLLAQGSRFLGVKVGQSLTYTCKAGRQTHKPVFYVCGFRYVKLENWPEAVKPENFTSIAVYSDLKMTGKFSCSDERINQLARNVLWSLKSYFLDIPTDCPTREHAGWTGDISVFCETACYFTDQRKFLKKWLKDFILEQGEDGSLPIVVPDGGCPDVYRSSCGWSDAIANVPMKLYEFYGDKEFLALVYEAATRFLAFEMKRAKGKKLLTGTKNSEYRQYVIETGYHYGEWLEPTRPMYKDFIKAIFCPDTEFTTAWFYRMASQCAEMADILGKNTDYKRYAELAEHIKKAYQYNFLPDGAVHSKRQCRYVRPLFMGLSDNAEIAAELNRMVVANGFRIGTGFHTTYKILPVLCDYGYVETAYKMLQCEDCPSWLFEVKQGATTTFENWNGIAEDGTVQDSQNHYSPGAVAAFLFAYTAGIRPLKPGFEKILIKPVPGGTLTHAEAEYDSVQGKITSAWRIDNGKFLLDITIPVSAQVELPDHTACEAAPGSHHFECLLKGEM